MFKCKKLKHKCIVAIDGEMTIYNAAALKQKLDAVLDDERVLEINLSRVSEIDSAGIQLLLLARKERAARQQTMSLVEHSEAVLDTFDTLALSAYFDADAGVRQT